MGGQSFLIPKPLQGVIRLTVKNRGYVDEQGWVHCPACARKTKTKVKLNTVMKYFPLYCSQCGQEITVDIEQMKLQLYCEPDA